MRKSIKQIIAGVMVSAVAVTSLAGCGSSEKEAASTTAKQTAAEAKEEPVQMEWLVGETSAEVDDNAEVVKMIEERFNIDLKTWYVDSNKFQENLNVRFAGGEMPDVLVVNDLSLLPTYVDGGILGELPIELIREKAPHYAAVADEHDDGTLWSTMIYKGKNYGVTNPMDAVPMAMFWRKDWLDHLGLQVPETLDDYEKVLTAFVEEDPDGNGKKDTAGMAERAFGAVFGAYGLRCVTGGSPGFKVEEMQLGEDNVPFFPYIHPDAKKALAKLHEWYEKGILDKEFITGENHGGYTWLSHSFMNGKIGLTSAQPSHYLQASTDTSDESNWSVCMKELKSLNPDADIVIGPAPVGPDGKSGTEGWNLTGRLTCLTTKGASDPRKVDAFLAMLDAYYADMDYVMLVNYGLEGKHYEMSDHGPIRLMNGTELRKEGVLQVGFGSTVTVAENITPQKTKFGHDVTGNGYYRFNAPPVEEFSNVIATLDTLTEQAYFEIITGVKPIDYFETFVEEFKAAGGEAAEKAVQKAYAEKVAAVKK
ncbi:extracellular solute-binding protein [Clostridium sp. MCC353]|uniref:extracellular solute-binding protein n=1 Tax=Clostridium sp. MCC353 TaxID=2592646 RepID=UPI001C02A15E|nr:extracellular solute-binding protein [Clostridium sp. MCC353]